MSQSSPPLQERYFSDYQDYWADTIDGATTSSRIINGQDAPLDRYPYFVALFDKNDNLRCDGTLIAPNIVLSAAHCQ
jgi:secreted trypsin-like serine protease